MALRFASIVEGKGELQALPVLIRRILAKINIRDAAIPKPVRIRRDKLLKDADDELSHAVSLAIAKLEGNPGTILILIDSEGGCAVDISRELRDRTHAVRSDVPIHVVVAHIQYETWFLAGASALAGQRGLPLNLSGHSSPEQVQDPKKWLTRSMTGSRAYSETTDQAAAAFSATFDMVAARRNCTSFDRFYRTVCAITAAQGPLP